jgi:homoserine O-acetyltransferase
VFFGIRHQRRQPGALQGAPTREKADALLDARLKAPFPADANDVLYQWDSSRDYNPSRGLEKIRRRCSRSTPPTTSATRPRSASSIGEIKRVKNGKVLLIPASADTAGHGTTGSAKWYAKELAALLASAPRIP